MKKSNSSISIQEPDKFEIRKALKVISQQHPLLSEAPRSWNNIPICLQDSIENIINSIIGNGK